MTSEIPVGEDDLQGFVDGRLTADRLLIVQAYLEMHPQVRAYLARDMKLRDELAGSLQAKYDEPIPATLRVETLITARRTSQNRWRRLSAAASVLFMLGGTMGWLANSFVMSVRSSAIHIMTTNAVAAYLTYTPEIKHPIEVSASGDGHLIQWLSNRLERPVIIPDLTSEHFYPMGGRVLPTSGTPAAQIMYNDEQGNRLTFYLQPMAAGITDFRYTESNGIRTYYRAENGIAFAVTAKIDQAQLLAVATAISTQIAKTPANSNYSF
jgi:anti-sigma factor RsiW